MMTSPQFRHALAMVVAGALLFGAAGTAAFAATPKGKKPKASSPAKSAKFMPGSQETPAARVSRLKRECKGQVNAGACEGYTR